MTRIDPEGVMAYAREANRDPDRRRPGPAFPGWAELPPDIALEVCRVCRCVVPATDIARVKHEEWHRGLRR